MKQNRQTLLGTKTLRPRRVLRGTALALAALAFTPVTNAIAQDARPFRASDVRAADSRRVRSLSLDAGTVIPVKLTEALTSRDSRPGDTFTARLRLDKDRDYSGLPPGTEIEGVVRDARPRRDKNPGVLDLEFRRLRLPNGRSYAIEGALIGLDSDSVTRTRDGRLIAKPGKKNDRLTYVGYGAGAGLLAGLLRKRPLEDAAIGAGLGYLFGALQKGGGNDPRDITLKAGTELGVRLERRLTFSAYDGDARDPDADIRDRDDRDDTDSGDYRNREDNRYDRDRNRDRADADDYELEDAAARLNRSRREQRDDLNAGKDSDRGRDDARDDARPGEEIGVMVGDRDVRFASNARPLREGKTVLVPFRPVLDALKIRAEYDAARGELRAFGPDGTARVTAASRVAVINNNTSGLRRERLETSARKLNGTLYVPVAFLRLASGRDVRWDSGSSTVLIGAEDEVRD